MSFKTAFLVSLLLPIMFLIGLIIIVPICDADLAFMANDNNQLGVEVETTFGATVVDVPIAGHVGFGYQRDDGKFVFGSFGPSPGNLPLWAPGTLTVEIFDNWAAVERYLITNYYTTYKTFNVDNPNPQNAWDTMERFKGSYYNLLTSVVDIKNSPLASLAGTNSEHPDSENCLTFAKKVLEAYGVKNLPSIVPFITSAPNNYFLSIPGDIHSTISDIEQGSTLPSSNEPMAPQESVTQAVVDALPVIYYGIATSNTNGEAWPFKLTINGPDSNGLIIGQIEWPSLNSIHEIEGTKTDASITFTETNYIKRGSAILNCRYYLTQNGNSFTGTWDGCEGQYGTIFGISSDLSNSYSGTATRSSDGETWPLKLTLIGPDSNGLIIGQIEWPSLNSIHEIEGTKTDASITFTETSYIKRGSAILNCRYYLTQNGKSFTGTWDGCEGQYGDITIDPL